MSSSAGSSAASLTVEEQTYGLGLKAVDAAIGLAHRLGLATRPLTGDHIKRQAMKRTRLSDFGDPCFEAPLARLMAEMPQHPMSSLGTVLTEQAMIKAMSNRLRLEAYVAQHPEVEAIAVERPIFVLGFPRTGTTLLQNLLSLDDTTRALQFWELQTPAPMHDDPAVDRKKRVGIAANTLRIAYTVAPEQRQIHEISATTVEECWPLFSNSFAVMNYDLQSRFESYGQWLLSHDMTGPYRYYKRTLQVLAHRHPPARYVLKCPEHLWFVDALLAVFPDARIVWTHRDPVASVASYCSLISLAQRMLMGRFYGPELGAHIQDRFHTGVQRAMAARQRWSAAGNTDSDTFFDVDFKTLVTDPAAVVADIKRWAGLPHDRAGEARVQRWLTTERGDKRGAHKYSAEVYGLDGRAIHKQYSDYIERFSIPCKPVG